MGREHGAQVEVAVAPGVDVSPSELEYMRTTIPQRVRNVLKGDPEGRKVYFVKVEITRYDEGSAFLRFLLIGLGQMYMDGTVEVLEGDKVVRSGSFQKNVRLGGLLGVTAKPRLMTEHLGQAVQTALQEKGKSE